MIKKDCDGCLWLSERHKLNHCIKNDDVDCQSITYFNDSFLINECKKCRNLNTVYNVLFCNKVGKEISLDVFTICLRHFSSSISDNV